MFITDSKSVISILVGPYFEGHLTKEGGALVCTAIRIAESIGRTECDIRLDEAFTRRFPHGASTREVIGTANREGEAIAKEISLPRK